MQHGFLNFLKDLSRKGVVSEVQSSSKLILKKVYTYVEGTCLWAIRRQYGSWGYQDFLNFFTRKFYKHKKHKK